jgi:hypothetical protein
MRDNLHGLSEVVSPPLALDNMLVYLAGRDIVLSSQRDVQVSLVVSQIEIDLSAIVQHEALAVLGGGHSSGIDVHVAEPESAQETPTCSRVLTDQSLSMTPSSQLS